MWFASKWKHWNSVHQTKHTDAVDTFPALALIFYSSLKPTWLYSDIPVYFFFHSLSIIVNFSGAQYEHHSEMMFKNTIIVSMITATFCIQVRLNIEERMRLGHCSFIHPICCLPATLSLFITGKGPPQDQYWIYYLVDKPFSVQHWHWHGA